MRLIVRDATALDAEGIAEIYNDAVRNTTAIWNEREVDGADRAAWIAARQAAGYPVLVAVTDDAPERVLGYGSFGDWRAFDGYRHTVEHSVYVHRDSRRLGLGGLLLDALIERARTLGKHAMVAAIEAGNTTSLRLHERCGFEDGGTMRQVGMKFGKWLDLTCLYLILDGRPTPDAE